MCKLFDDWSEEIEKYCKHNGLDFEKAKRMTQSWSKNSVLLGYFNGENNADGLLNDTPMPVVLAIFKQPDGSLKFEQTEHTRKYLA